MKLMVPKTGIEPARLSATGPKPIASTVPPLGHVSGLVPTTSSPVHPNQKSFVVALEGVEPSCPLGTRF